MHGQWELILESIKTGMRTWDVDRTSIYPPCQPAFTRVSIRGYPCLKRFYVPAHSKFGKDLLLSEDSRILLQIDCFPALSSSYHQAKLLAVSQRYPHLTPGNSNMCPHRISVLLPVQKKEQIRQNPRNIFQEHYHCRPICVVFGRVIRVLPWTFDVLRIRGPIVCWRGLTWALVVQNLDSPAYHLEPAYDFLLRP